MRLHRRFQRSLAAALAALALAAPSALAVPGYEYHATAGTSVEEQLSQLARQGRTATLEAPRRPRPPRRRPTRASTVAPLPSARPPPRASSRSSA